MTFPDTFYSAFLWGASVLICVLVASQIYLLIRLRARSGTGQSPPDLTRRLQRVWRAPLILNDSDLAQRVVDITTAPVLKQNYRTTLTINTDHVATAANRERLGAGRVVYELQLESEFEFVNVTAHDLTLRIKQPAESLGLVAKRPKFSEIVVAGKSVSIDEGAYYEITVAAESETAVKLRSKLYGDLPLILEIPQTTIVRSGAEVRIVSGIAGRIGLLVIGSDECSFCTDHSGREPFDRLVRTTKPLLPGESLIFFVGAGSSTSRGVPLRAAAFTS